MRDTSQGAWEVVKETLSPARAAVYRILLDGEPRTASEIGGADPVTGKCYWKRVSELVEMGLLHECFERPCRVTGQTVITYAIVPGALPTAGKTPAPLKPTEEEIHKALNQILVLLAGPPKVQACPELLKLGKWLRYKAL
jgi:hypothetical protein